MAEYIYTTEGAFGLRECTGEEIVRCRDCKHIKYCKHYSTRDDKPDGFCAWGIRRDDV